MSVLGGGVEGQGGRLRAQGCGSGRRQAAPTAQWVPGRLLMYQPALPPPNFRFFFYTTVDVRALRSLEQTRALHPKAQGVVAWLEAHKERLEPLFA